MRCLACNAELSDYEAVRKDLHGQYLDMCNNCLRDIREDVLTDGGDSLDYTVNPTPSDEWSSE